MGVPPGGNPLPSNAEITDVVFVGVGSMTDCAALVLAMFCTAFQPDIRFVLASTKPFKPIGRFIISKRLPLLRAAIRLI